MPSSVAVGLTAQGSRPGLVPDDREVITKQQLLLLWMRREARSSTGQAISVAMAPQAVLRAFLPAHAVWKSGVQETGWVSAAHMVWFACQGALSRPAWPGCTVCTCTATNCWLPAALSTWLGAWAWHCFGADHAWLHAVRLNAGCPLVVMSCRLLQGAAAACCACHLAHILTRAHTGIHTYTLNCAEMSQQGRYPSAGEHGPSPSRYLAGGRRVLLATR